MTDGQVPQQGDVGSGQGSVSGDAALRARAEERIGAKKAFWASVAGFVFVNVICWTVWLLASGWRNEGLPWPVWLLVWGVFVAWNGIRVYGPASRPTREEEIQREMRRLQGR